MNNICQVFEIYFQGEKENVDNIAKAYFEA